MTFVYASTLTWMLAVCTDSVFLTITVRIVDIMYTLTSVYTGWIARH